MSNPPLSQELRERQQRAMHVYQEMLTAVSPEVRSAFESLYDLTIAERNLCRCNCTVDSTEKNNPQGVKEDA